VDVAVDPLDYVFVATSINEIHTIKKFTNNGTLIRQWSSGDSQFGHPTGIAVDKSGNVFVIGYNDRVQKFTNTGNFIRKWGSGGEGDGQFLNAEDVSVDSSGNVFVADTGNHRIQKFTNTGTFITKWE
jgi:tripartite motif-containing protein 71